MRFALVALLSLVWSTSASAVTLVTVNFSGSLYDATASVSSRFQVGDVVEGSLTFDAEAPGQGWNSHTQFFPTGITNGYLDVDGYVAQFGSSARMFVTDDEPHEDGIDRFIIDDFSATASSVNELPFYGLFLNWQDNSASASRGLLLPTNQTQFDAYGTPTGAIDWVSGDAQNRVTFALTTVTVNSAVPEPSAWAMMIVGFALVGGSIRSSRRSKANRLATQQ